ncbi:hypothetical protein [Tropicimonas sediminicola]|uniref:Dynamin family protein n=1 Tax=Tropicimonas sediminicola TaxID=1031541 RepID=A0A239JPR7_9RHOB|nr:hypothetical protein [Tropicimonas sediminicola]SNT07837.1 hypothetical protein SAMN05421757_1065 [Tropicimonas sediminicola]
MSQHATFDQICDRLHALIEGGHLPDKAAQQAGRLLQRLETPVRFSLLGPSSLERARIINALLGRDVVPLWPARPSVQLGFGDAPATSATLSNGRRVSVESLDAGLAPDTVFLSLTRNEPLLRTTRLLDVVTDGTPAELRMALRWAAKRTDVFLWCTNRFEPAELEVWRSVEERFMDHAFLVLWGEDRELRARQLKAELAGEFLDVIAVDLDAVAPSADPGLRSLSEGLRRHVDLGRQADNDSALLFLKKFADLAGQPDLAREETAPRPSAAAPLTAPVSMPVSFRDQPPAAEPDAPAADPVERRALEQVCRQGLSLICDRARQLGALLREDGAGSSEGIAAHCRQTIEHLTGILDSAADLPHEDRAALSDMLMSAEELLVLMEIEGDGQPGVDSLCLLIQLRRAFEERLAA